MEIWKLRVAASRDAQKRTRGVFLVATVVSISLLIGLYNSYFSWYIHIVDKIKSSTTAPTTQESWIEQELVNGFVAANRITISLMGVNIGMSDAAVLGSASLCIITVWWFYAARRENHLIAELLTDATRAQTLEEKVYVYHGITSYTVFNTITNSNAPIKTLGQNPPPPVASAGLSKFFVPLIFLPATTILLIFISEIISVSQVSPVARIRPGSAPKLVIETLFENHVWFLHWIVMMAVALCFFIVTSFLCRFVTGFAEANGALLREFRGKLDVDQKVSS
jgi:hypothetical protein